ncbi:MAG: phosphoribosyltransferase [bacterium]|jgi:putative phosphoribosyl transferase
MMFDDDIERFEDREEAGKALALEIKKRKIKADFIIALPRGGVPVGKVIAEELHIPLRLCYVKKIGHPVNEEYAIGAVTEEDELIINNENIDEDYTNKKIIGARLRIKEMKSRFGHHYDINELIDKIVILVDDGIATGICLKLAVTVMKKQKAKKIIIATPVCAANTVNVMQEISDLFICLLQPQYFVGIGAYYNNFKQLTDKEVVSQLSS